MSAPVSAERVSVRLGTALVVQDASLTLARGQLTALVGPNGAGKTTLVRALAGLIEAQGRIALDGRALSAVSARERARLIAYLPQGATFHWPIPVRSAVALGRYPFGDPFSPPTPEDREAVDKALAATATADLSERPVTSLSGGERARVALARALATQAPILLVDEPTVSLDARHQLLVMQLLRDAARSGAAVLAVIHDLSLAARFSDRVAMMKRGQVTAIGTASDVLTQERIAQTFGVEPAMIDLDGIRVPIAHRAL